MLRCRRRALIPERFHQHVEGAVMKRLTIVVIAAAALIISAPVIAQQSGAGDPPLERNAGSPRSYGWGPGMMMGPGMMGWSGGGMMCDPRAAGLAEWRIDRIERLISPNEAQRAALDNLRAASVKAAETVLTDCPPELPVSATGRLETIEKRLDAMLTAVRLVRPAFDAFYATLDDEQKARINSGGSSRWGWHGWRGN
jgi:hypothetical protein